MCKRLHILEVKQVKHILRCHKLGFRWHASSKAQQGNKIRCYSDCGVKTSITTPRSRTTNVSLASYVCVPSDTVYVNSRPLRDLFPQEYASFLNSPVPLTVRGEPSGVDTVHELPSKSRSRFNEPSINSDWEGTLKDT